MKSLFVFTVLLALTSCSHNTATPMAAFEPLPDMAMSAPEREIASEGSRYLTDRYMKIANLEGVQIIGEESVDQVQRSVKAIKVTESFKERLKAESGDEDLLSQIYGWTKKDETSVFVFITKTKKADKDVYRINLVRQYTSGNLSLIDFDITDALPREMRAVNGPTNALEKYKVIAKTSFFPI